MKWFEERINRVAEYARKSFGEDVSGGVALVDSPAPVVANTEKNNYDIETVVTTDAVDLSGEVVAPGGGDWTYLDRVKSVFVDHDPSIAATVGAMRFRARIMQSDRLRGWRARIRMDQSKQLARECMGLAKIGVLHSSIGMVVVEKGAPTKDERALYDTPVAKAKTILRKWRAIEVTLTAAPMNQECVANPVEYIEKARGNIEGWLSKGIISKDLARAMGMDTAPSKIVVGFHGGYTWRRRN